MTSASNDNETAFNHFMVAYWNQMADEFYTTLGEALSDFRLNEEKKLYNSLISEITSLLDAEKFPLMSDIKSAYCDPFWGKYDRIIALEDLESCKTALGRGP